LAGDDHSRQHIENHQPDVDPVVEFSLVMCTLITRQSAPPPHSSSQVQPPSRRTAAPL
jgi:hypothetical protein